MAISALADFHRAIQVSQPFEKMLTKIAWQRSAKRALVQIYIDHGHRIIRRRIILAAVPPKAGRPEIRVGHPLPFAVPCESLTHF